MDSTNTPYLQVEVYLKTKPEVKSLISFPLLAPDSTNYLVSKEFISHVNDVLKSTPPYDVLQFSGVDFDFVCPIVSYIGEDTNEEVTLTINPDKPTDTIAPRPQQFLNDNNEAFVLVKVSMEFVVRPASNNSSVELDKKLDKTIYFLSSLKSTSNPNRTETNRTGSNRIESTKRSQCDVQGSSFKKSKKR